MMHEMGVISYSEKKNNLLMWAHYADMHRGICLEFSMDHDKWKGGVHKVGYSKKLPILDFSNGFWNNAAMKILLTKSIDWKYEKEWRRINKKGGQLLPYVGTLSSLIFGYRTPNQDKELIKSILKNEVKYYDSKLSESEFKVEILPHST
jgi:hypothetical protein